MTTPICSVLIPSRTRPERLLKTIASIRATAVRPAPEDVEIIVRFDDDDHLSLGIMKDLFAQDVRVLVGQRRKGFDSVGEFYGEMCDVSEGTWIWVMNDDAYVTATTEPWDAQLRLLPTKGLIVQPEIYQLGFSIYPRSEGAAFPLAPNGCWKQFGFEHVPDPIDTRLDEILRLKHGWRTHFLHGVAVVHERDDDATLEKHRSFV